MKIEIESLVWDRFNKKHIGKHSVSILEIEEICFGKVKAKFAKFDRCLIIGKTEGGRKLTIILSQKGKKLFYVVSARDASKKERRLYEYEKNKN